MNNKMIIINENNDTKNDHIIRNDNYNLIIINYKNNTIDSI